MREPLSPQRVETLRTWFQDGIPFNRALGLRVDALARGRAVLRIPWKDELTGDASRPAVHGGVLSMLIDTAGGAACFAMLGSDDDRVSTVDLRVDYLRPGPAADLVCEAEVIRLGNRVAVTRARVHSATLPSDDEDDPIALGQAVYNIVRR
ncbi:MAG: thioesterase family protein [Nannocystaceae bacterium]|nr:thioesterase family protein [bacterium]